MAEVERSLAVFIDFENLALGFQGRRERFDIGRVLERLVEKGKIVVKKAYADWIRFSTYSPALHEAAIELIEIPKRAQSGKNSADIRLCVDAMDLAYSKDHIDTFAVISGDSDFSPLVSKLKELGKHVIGLGMQESTSELLRDNCDEFIYYEDLGQEPTLAPTIVSHLPEAKKKAFALLLESLQALRRENKDVLWSSMIKDTIKRKKPSFNEMYHGYRTFSEMLEDAQREGLLELETDKRSRTYVVRRFGSEMHQEGTPPPSDDALESAAPPGGAEAPSQPVVLGPDGQPIGARKRSRRRRRRGSGQGAGNGNGSYPQHTPIPPGPAAPVARPTEAAALPPAMPPRPPAPPVARAEPPRVAPAPPRAPVGFDAGLDDPHPTSEKQPAPPAAEPTRDEAAAEPAPARKPRARAPRAAAPKSAAKPAKTTPRGRSRKKAEPEADAAGEASA